MRLSKDRDSTTSEQPIPVFDHNSKVKQTVLMFKCNFLYFRLQPFPIFLFSCPENHWEESDSIFSSPIRCLYTLISYPEPSLLKTKQSQLSASPCTTDAPSPYSSSQSFSGLVPTWPFVSWTVEPRTEA